MSRKRGAPVIVQNVEVIDIAEEGKGVGKANDLVYFIDKAVPGDVVDILQLKKKKSFADARIERLVRPSAERREPFCQHFGVCGGCKWQHMDYSAQLFYKNKSVINALSRIGKVDVSMAESILPSVKDKFYRNKLEYTFSNKRWLQDADVAEEGGVMDALGFHVPGRFDKILDIKKCWLQEDPSNAIRNGVREFAIANGYTFYDLRQHTGSLRNLIIRTASTGDLMVCMVFGYATPEEIERMMAYINRAFPQITALLYIINHKLNDTIFDQDVHVYAGQDYITEEMEGLRYKIGVKSFYQTNSAQAYELYKITRDFAGLTGNELVYDLYTGAGTIANFVARQARTVVGVEYVPTAIDDARYNSRLNGIANTVFYAGDMKNILSAGFVAEHGKPDVVITDPPRAGMHADVVARLLEMASPRIVYVSCNAATQARDLALLAEKYAVKRIKPVDMFPHTQHVENVVLLELI